MDNAQQLYVVTRDTLINQGVVFFGGYAFGLYSKYSNGKYKMNEVPDFDVLSEDPDRTAMIVKEQLMQNNFKKVKIVRHKQIGELVPERYEILVGPETIAMIYKPIACHSYNKIQINNNEVNVATIDTILSFYLVMIYLDVELNYNRLICMANFLFEIQAKNRLNQRGLLKRFAMTCNGKQSTLEDIRAEKALKYKEFKDGKVKRDEYDMWFLKYNPGEKQIKAKHNKTRKNIKSISETSPEPEKEPKKKTILDILLAAKTH